MYTDDEVEEIHRENIDDGGERVDSYTSAKKLFATLLVSFLTLSVVAYFVLGTGTAAVVVSGAGGFYAEIDQINANGAWIYPAVTQTATCQSNVTTASGRPNPGNVALPVLRVDLRDAQIPTGQKVKFIKSINTPNLFSINTFSVVVQQTGTPSSTQLKNTTVFVSRLQGDNLGLGQVIANESYSRTASQDPAPKNEKFGPSTIGYFQRNNIRKNLTMLGEFAIRGQTGEVSNANGIVHLVSFERLSIPNLNVTLAYDKYDQYAASGGCPV